MTWYAIRTAPGAQMPQREFVVEDSPKSRKGYRIVPSLNQNVSAIERALSDAGFAHFMPVERRVVRDRKKANVWKLRRFPLLTGYAFVRDVTDFKRLEKVPGVVDVVKVSGSPYRMALGDIQTLATIESECDAKAEHHLRALNERASRPTRKRTQAMFPTGRGVIVTMLGEARHGTVIGPCRDGRLKVIMGMLQEISVPVDALELVA